jgi:hypothetical protein
MLPTIVVDGHSILKLIATRSRGSHFRQVKEMGFIQQMKPHLGWLARRVRIIDYCNRPLNGSEAATLLELNAHYWIPLRLPSANLFTHPFLRFPLSPF